MIRDFELNASSCDLAEALQKIKSRLKSRMAHANLFLLPKDGAGPASASVAAFLCGYFDEKDAYLFRPSQIRVLPGS